jgi:hypothetical protein
VAHHGSAACDVEAEVNCPEQRAPADGRRCHGERPRLSANVGIPIRKPRIERQKLGSDRVEGVSGGGPWRTIRPAGVVREETWGSIPVRAGGDLPPICARFDLYGKATGSAAPALATKGTRSQHGLCPTGAGATGCAGGQGRSLA